MTREIKKKEKIDHYSKKLLSYLTSKSGAISSLIEVTKAVGLNHSQKLLHRLHILEKYGYIHRIEKNLYDVAPDGKPFEYIMVRKSEYDYLKILDKRGILSS